MHDDPLNPRRHPQETRNLILAVVVSFAILLGFEFFIRPAVLPPAPVVQATAAAAQPAASAVAMPDLTGTPPVAEPDSTALWPINTPQFTGTLAQAGGTLHQLDLRQFKDEFDHTQHVHQFIPTGVDAHQFDVGFQGNGIYGPDGGTPWQLAAGSSAELGVDKPIVLTWSNATGQVFERVWSVDKDFSLRLTDRVKNTSTNAVELAPYAQIHQVGGHRKDEISTFVQFIGPKGWVDEHRFEKNFTDLHTQPFKTTGTKGWWGISSRYFISAIVPQGTMPNTFHFRHSKRGETDYYSAIVQPPAMVVAPGQTAEVAYVVYAGPKAIAPLAAVNPLLEKAVDYGWFDVIARPMFYALEWFHTHTGNWGVAIILLTLLIKLLTWPLASTSYVAMSRMKKLTPKMEQLKERYKDDKEKFAMEMMNLYKTEKVNPLSGCWPVLMQIPIFFAMYKVILVSFEFRQAPFFGWITDLSVMDPFFVLPIIMGASMWLQMKMNPPATDPVQQQVMQLMPIIFTVMFLWFPSGLVLYWLVNNVLSIAQQYWIMRKMGVNIS